MSESTVQNALHQPACAQVTELLYLKQTQLERMAAEKAAQHMALERELSVAREEAARVQRWGKFLCIGPQCDTISPLT